MFLYVRSFGLIVVVSYSNLEKGKNLGLRKVFPQMYASNNIVQYTVLLLGLQQVLVPGVDDGWPRLRGGHGPGGAVGGRQGLPVEVLVLAADHERAHGLGGRLRGLVLPADHDGGANLRCEF